MSETIYKIDVFDYIDSEEDVEENGERLYVNATRLLDDIIFKLENDPEFKDHIVEVDLYESN
jgi:hypothetical protein